MNKILVEVYLPSAERSFDLYIPLELKIDEATIVISSLLSELSVGKYIGTKESLLCNANNGLIYDINIRVADSGIMNGTKLMLI